MSSVQHPGLYFFGLALFASIWLLMALIGGQWSCIMEGKCGASPGMSQAKAVPVITTPTIPDDRNSTATAQVQSALDDAKDFFAIVQILWIVSLAPFVVFLLLGMINPRGFEWRRKAKTLANEDSEARRVHLQSDGTKISYRVVTRGTNPSLVADVAKRNIPLLREKATMPFIYEVATDRPLNLACHLSELGIGAGGHDAEGGLAVNEIVVPDSYKPPGGAEGDIVVHLDEETLLTHSCVAGIEEFVRADASRVGSGTIAYGQDVIVNPWLTMADSLRVTDDYCKMRLFFSSFKPLIGMKGSFVVCPVAVERRVTWDHGRDGSITEDTTFALKAVGEGVRFGWVKGVMREKSPFGIVDFMKQRRRWFQGLWRDAVKKELKLHTRLRDIVVHLDEETLLTHSCVAGIEEFVRADASRVGSGTIAYGQDVIVNPWLTMADSLRVTDDYCKMRLFFSSFKPLIGMKGSFVVCPVAVERRVTWDHGRDGSITEDTTFALKAVGEGVRFGWVKGVMREKSPFGIVDFMKQRRRWFQGLWRDAVKKELKLHTRLMLGYCLAMWSFIPLWNLLMLLELTCEHGLGHPIPYPATPLLMAIKTTWMTAFVWGYLFGAMMNFSPAQPFSYLLYVAATVPLMPLWAVCEGLAVLYAMLTKTAGFHIVQKEHPGIAAVAQPADHPSTSMCVKRDSVGGSETAALIPKTTSAQQCLPVARHCLAVPVARLSPEQRSDTSPVLSSVSSDPIGRRRAESFDLDALIDTTSCSSDNNDAEGDGEGSTSNGEGSDK
ncbi:unnamed protein product [Vitrella brassicaformis CCMP3155]|uniref:Glycosyltransferase 2-like domain-containing protein n=1 Tax=Vitrella brassicaformis (strain CCMP3155) TaxID=1169540 RepID=A0A0G4EMQ4_VITBC|nr:unnamed protein product [Vitrella brassicaformis CCMP3155]|eukprot:CEL98094.1 unnamed protein product [Vitrella brassicaformis CCMP3155]